MTGSVRVSSLAKSVGLSSKELIKKLAEIGEYVKSASSTVSTPVARRIHEMYPDAEPIRHEAAAHRNEPARVGPDMLLSLQDHPDSFLGSVPRSAPPRGPYRGDAPFGLVRAILDQYILPRTAHGRRPHGALRYWANEVAEAKSIAKAWAGNMVDGMSQDEVVRWIKVLSQVDQETAAALFAEGIDPDEIAFDSRFDFGRPSLQTRLSVKNITPRQAIDEVRARRQAG